MKPDQRKHAFGGGRPILDKHHKAKRAWSGVSPIGGLSQHLQYRVSSIPTGAIFCHDLAGLKALPATIRNLEVDFSWLESGNRGNLPVHRGWRVGDLPFVSEKCLSNATTIGHQYAATPNTRKPLSLVTSRIPSQHPTLKHDTPLPRPGKQVRQVCRGLRRVQHVHHGRGVDEIGQKGVVEQLLGLALRGDQAGRDLRRGLAIRRWPR